jgi:O-antigen/teichoic acid export membrane protein
MLLIPKYGIVGGAAATTIASLSGLIPLLGIYIKDYKPKLDLRITIPYSIFTVMIYWLPKNSKLEIIVVTLVAGAVYLLSLFVLRIITAKDMEIIISGVIPKESYPVKRIIALVSALNGIGK